jgi:phospholipase A-2-activating protein
MSTSWDCTARVWGTREWDEKLVLEGHKEAVWAGAIVEGVDCGRKDGERSFLTGSADRTIIHWDGHGKPIRNFKGKRHESAGRT